MELPVARPISKESNLDNHVRHVLSSCLVEMTIVRFFLQDKAGEKIDWFSIYFLLILFCMRKRTVFIYSAQPKQIDSSLSHLSTITTTTLPILWLTRRRAWSLRNGSTVVVFVRREIGQIAVKNPTCHPYPCSQCLQVQEVPARDVSPPFSNNLLG